MEVRWSVLTPGCGGLLLRVALKTPSWGRLTEDPVTVSLTVTEDPVLVSLKTPSWGQRPRGATEWVRFYEGAKECAPWGNWWIDMSRGVNCVRKMRQRGGLQWIGMARSCRVAFLWGPGLVEGAKVEAKRGCWVNRYVPRGEMCAKNEAKRGSWVNRKWYVITT